MDAAVADPTILSGHYHLPLYSSLPLVDGITQGTPSIVSDESFNPDSSIGPAGNSTVVSPPSVDCNTFKLRIIAE